MLPSSGWSAGAAARRAGRHFGLDYDYEARTPQPGEPGPEDAFRPAMFTAEGKTVMLAFTSEERLHGYGGVGPSDSPQAFSIRAIGSPSESTAT